MENCLITIDRNTHATSTFSSNINKNKLAPLAFV